MSDFPVTVLLIEFVSSEAPEEDFSIDVLHVFLSLCITRDISIIFPLKWCYSDFFKLSTLSCNSA